MGELYPPTAADYASASADRALEEIAELKKILRAAGIKLPEKKRKPAKSLSEFLVDIYTTKKF